MPKEHVAIFALLCIIAFGAGYWHSSPKEDSDERAEASVPPAPTVVTNVVTNVLKGVVTNIVTAAPQTNNSPPKVTNSLPISQIAINKGVDSLIRMQDSNGSFYDPQARHHRSLYAMTSLAIMAISDAGHRPDMTSKEGHAMLKGLEFILRPDPKRGKFEYFGADGGRMYGHGITTLCLSQLIDTVPPAQESRFRTVTTNAVKLILLSQKVTKSNPTNRGGWRYNPTSLDADISVSAWQLRALVSAKNSGFNVPQESIDAAKRFFQRCYFSPRNARGEPTNMNSGYGYIPGQTPKLSTAAAGLLALIECGGEGLPETIGSEVWLSGQPVTSEEQWFYYGIYYYCQAMKQLGPAYQQKASKKILPILLNLQQADGSWLGKDGNEAGAGRIYCTALAVSSLSALLAKAKPETTQPETPTTPITSLLKLPKLGEHLEISIRDLEKAVEVGEVVLIDVNGQSSFNKRGHIPGAVPFSNRDTLARQLSRVSKDTLVVAYCGNPSDQAWRRGASAATDLGFKHVMFLGAGIAGWIKAGKKLDKN